MSWKLAGNLCTNLVLKLAGEKHRNLALIVLSWRNIVGDLLAERSTPYRYEFNVLFVRATNSVWLQELILLKQQIMEKITDNLNIPISDIVFIVGSKK